MHTNLVTSALLAAAIAFGAAPAAAQESPLKRLIPVGRDGDKTYFTAVCRDGRRASVVERSGTQDTCASSVSGKERCKKDWRLMEAGAYACTVGKGD